MKIYTGGGDDGSTGLYGGARLSKADQRVEAYGAVDEVNAMVGWVRAARPSENWLPIPAAALLSVSQRFNYSHPVGESYGTKMPIASTS